MMYQITYQKRNYLGNGCGLQPASTRVSIFLSEFQLPVTCLSYISLFCSCCRKFKIDLLSYKLLSPYCHEPNPTQDQFYLHVGTIQLSLTTRLSNIPTGTADSTEIEWKYINYISSCPSEARVEMLAEEEKKQREKAKADHNSSGLSTIHSSFNS
jgi:hypothetical protein